MMLTFGLTSLLVLVGVLRRGNDRPTQLLVSALYGVYLYVVIGGPL